MVYSKSIPNPDQAYSTLTSDHRLILSYSLAMAEMTTLLAAVYREYATSLQERQKGVSPGITSRYEVFYDATFEKMEVSGWIPFQGGDG